jgi:hypothetical protein
LVTISIREETRKKILSIAGELQKQKGVRVDFDQAISYLADAHKTNERKKELFELFCKPVPKAKFEDLYGALVKERRMDESRRHGYST